MRGIIFGEALDSEIVHAEDEGGPSCFVMPQARCERHWLVAVRFQFFDELVESKDAGFLEAAHAFSDFEIDETAVVDLDVVAGIVPNFLGNAPRLDPHVLATVHGGAETAVADVQAEVTSSFVGVRDGTADMDFCVEHGDGGGAWIAGIFELGSACGHADPVSLGFLLADAADVVGARHFSICWDL